MTFWMLAGLLTAVTVVITVLPLLRGAGRPVTEGSAVPPLDEGTRRDLALFQSQLAEIDADVAAGRMAAAEAETARAEVKRRILSRDPAHNGAAIQGRPPARLLGVLLLFALPAAAMTLYVELGQPGMPDMPAGSRTPPQGPGGTTEAPDIDAMLARLEARLANNMDDVEGWRMAARSYTALERWDDAALAYEMLLDLEDPTPELLVRYGEALGRARGDGSVPPAALEAFAQALEMDPNHTVAAYFTALGLAQAGEVRPAARLWAWMLDRHADDQGPWRTRVEALLSSAAQELGVPESAISPDMPDLAEVASAAEAAKEAQRKAEAAAREKAATLRQQVADTPDDVAAWRELAQQASRMGAPEEALRAWRAVLEHTPDDAEAHLAAARALLATQAWEGETPLPEEARTHLLAAVDGGVDQPQAVFLAALGAEQAGNGAKARELYQRLLLRLDPLSTLYRETERRLQALENEETQP